MAISLLKDRGTPLAKQVFTWKELVPKTLSKLDDDAFTRVRIILLNGGNLEISTQQSNYTITAVCPVAIRLPF